MLPANTRCSISSTGSRPKHRPSFSPPPLRPRNSESGCPISFRAYRADTQIALKPLGDAARREAVRKRASARGIELDNAVIDWMFEHTPRDLGSLAALIERIDRESLAAKRRITVPFLRTLTGGG